MLILLAAAPALAALSFDSLDRNQDGHISKKERYGQINGYSRWDRSDNSMIERSEFERSQFGDEKFSDWDPNGDGEIDSKSFYDDVFGEYDKDRNGRWTHGEYRAALDQQAGRASGLMTSNAADASVTRSRPCILLAYRA